MELYQLSYSRISTHFVRSMQALRPLVGVRGFEPPASCSQSKRSTKLSYTPKKKAGDEARTRDPDLGKVVLYQLSYSRS